MTTEQQNTQIRSLIIDALNKIQDDFGLAIDRIDVHWERPAIKDQTQKQKAVFLDLNISGYV